MTPNKYEVDYNIWSKLSDSMDADGLVCWGDIHHKAMEILDILRGLRGGTWERERERRHFYTKWGEERYIKTSLKQIGIRICNPTLSPNDILEEK